MGLGDFIKDPIGSIGEAIGIDNLSLSSTIDSIGEYIGEKIIDYLSQDPDYADRKVNPRGPTNARRVIYGKARVGGQVVYIESTGTNKEFLDVIYVIASHPCQSIGDIYVNDELITESKYNGFITAEYSISGDGNLLPIVSQNTSLTAARHKFEGLSYIYVRFKYDNDLFQGQPNITAIVEGKNNIYDPRTLSTGYTTNAALCERDWLVNYLNAENLDNSWIEAANDCDVQVAAATGTEPRFEINGTITLSGSRIESLAKMVANSGVITRYEQGVWGAVIQKYVAPDTDASFDENDLLSDIQVQTGNSKQDKINTVKGSYIDARTDYEQVEYPALESASYLAEDLEKLETTIDYQMVSSPTQCRRLSKILLEKSRFGLTVSGTFRFGIWQYPVGSTIKFSYARFGWVDRVFRIVSRDIDGINGIQVVMQEDAPEIYDWNEGDAIDIEVPNPVDLPDPDIVASPLSFSVSESLYIANTSKSYKARGNLSWSSDDLSARHFEVEGSFNGGPYRIFNDYIVGNEYSIDDLELGEWVFRVRAVNGLGIKSDYTTYAITVLGKFAPPADVTGFTGVIQPFSIELVWDKSPDIDVDQYEIRIGSDWDTATSLQAISALKWKWETRPTGNEVILIKAIDTSSNYSLNASPASIVIQPPKVVEPLLVNVVDNNVELRWADGTASFNIDAYEVRKGDIYETAEVIGSAKGTFKSKLENVGGAFRYWVTGIDVQGNRGEPTSVLANVDQPPDFVLQSNQLIDLTTGTKVNLIEIEGSSITFDSDSAFTWDSTTAFTFDLAKTVALTGPVNTTETFDEHFKKLPDFFQPLTFDSDNAFTWDSTTAFSFDESYKSIRELQVDAGYPYYLQPSEASGSYENVVDFFGVLSLSRIQLIPSITTIAGSADIEYTIGYSEDGVTYTEVSGTEATGINFRYIKVRLDITSASGEDLIRINSLRLRLDVKLKTDAGIVEVTDLVNPTDFLFNLEFVDIQSIQVTANGVDKLATYNFVDAPNPTGASVNLQDLLTGNRVAGEVSWNVRGV